MQFYRRWFGLGLFALCACWTPSAPAQTEGGTVEVHVHYTGTGTVDESHKIYIALWDSPSFVGGGTSGIAPMELKPVTSKNGTAVFTGVTKSPVYLSSVYDPKGQWDGESAPPEGSSLGLFSKEPGQPEPTKVEPGKTVTISFQFDDSFKMPSQ